ncbi:response regulator [Paenibacillaceae bacterium WGS1546]|uniref:response regulator n=1 Tax=Cohnella sp. WGS1546 TaxID=3366810 RepID=UPI00372D700A
MEHEEPTRILVVDDHPVFREGMLAILSGVEKFEVIGEAATGGEAIAMAEEHQPDIVLMDIDLPDRSGIDSTREILRASPHIRVIMLSMIDDDASIFSAMGAGARGYLLKGARRKEIVRAVFAVADGWSIFSSAIAQRMMFYFDAQKQDPRSNIFPELTSREREVLGLLSRGNNNSEIGTLLGLRPKTVRNHISNILNKLQVTDRSKAIIMARESGL